MLKFKDHDAPRPVIKPHVCTIDGDNDRAGKKYCCFQNGAQIIADYRKQTSVLLDVSWRKNCVDYWEN